MIHHQKCESQRARVVNFKRNEILLVITLVVLMVVLNSQIHLYVPEKMRKYLNKVYYGLEEDIRSAQSFQDVMLYPYMNQSDVWVKAIEFHTEHYSLTKNQKDQKFLLCAAKSGFGNRMNHIVSCFALAMILNRVLIVDWQPEMYEYFVLTGEITGMDSFDEIFQRPKNMKLLQEMPSPITSEVCKSSHVVFKDDWEHCDQACFLHVLQRMKSLSITCIEKTSEYDYWGNSLFFDNSKKLFKKFTKNPFIWQTNPQSGYSYMARFLFQPKYVFPELENLKNKTCEWLIQRRTKWSRGSVSTLDMIKCARKNGLRSWKHMQILSDDPNDQHDFENNPLPNCRGSIGCDAKTIQAMFILSQCKNAVITQLSTFGLCIVYLGNMEKNTWVASPNQSTIEGDKDIEPMTQKKMKKC